MARISSQGAIIQIGDETVAPPATPLAISTVTNAKPAEATIGVTGTPPAIGDVVIPRNTGWNSIEGKAFPVVAVAGQVVTLGDSDTTKETTVVGVDATLEVQTMLELCRSTFTLTGPAGATIDVTTLCDEAHRIVSGLPAINTWAANGFYDYQDTALKLARQYYRDGDTVPFKITFKDMSGLVFMGTVNTYDVTLGINAAVGTNIAGNVDGQVAFFEPPVVP
jgi:hypothetical protein